MLFSEPKISQLIEHQALERAREGFSALQRAENFSIVRVTVGVPGVSVFQCSSASRKFLNEAEWKARRAGWRVSVLFSEPKISQ